MSATAFLVQLKPAKWQLKFGDIVTKSSLTETDSIEHIIYKVNGSTVEAIQEIETMHRHFRT